jgi:hypothetical protein
MGESRRRLAIHLQGARLFGCWRYQFGIHLRLLSMLVRYKERKAMGRTNMGTAIGMLLVRMNRHASMGM